MRHLLAVAVTESVGMHNTVEYIVVRKFSARYKFFASQ